MNLTKNFPRSPYDTVSGLVILARTIDKAKAFNKDSLGEYHYNCSLDKSLFNFLGINSETFAKKVKELKTDEKVAEWVNKEFKKKDQFNNERRHSRPKDKNSKKWMESEKKRLGRNDYETYFDNIDADEKRF